MRISDWSSDVCSSDLPSVYEVGPFREQEADAELAGVLRRHRVLQIPLDGRLIGEPQCAEMRLEQARSNRVQRMHVQSLAETWLIADQTTQLGLDRKSTRLNSSH